MQTWSRGSGCVSVSQLSASFQLVVPAPPSQLIVHVLGSALDRARDPRRSREAATGVSTSRIAPATIHVADKFALTSLSPSLNPFAARHSFCTISGGIQWPAPLQRRELCEQTIDLLRGVVVDDPDPQRALRQAEPVHHLD